MNGIILQKGQIFTTNNCGDFEILEETTDKNLILDYNTQRFKIRFLKTNTKKEVFWQDIRRKSIQDYNIKTICGVACKGEGFYTSKDEAYSRWKSIINRCYNQKSSKYKSYGEKGIKVCDKWLNYQNFAKWFYIHKEKDLNYVVDKDILSKIKHLENKIYSPNTCLLIPSELNNFIIGDSPNSGVYKKEDKFWSQITYKNKKQFLGNFNRFSEAKDVYIKYKYEIWCELVNNSNISNKLKDILLQYNFKWN